MFSATDPYYILRNTTRNDDPTLPSVQPATLPSWGIALAVILPIIAIIVPFAFLFIRHRRNKVEEKKAVSNDIENIMVQKFGVDESHVSDSTLVSSQVGSTIKKQKH